MRRATALTLFLVLLVAACGGDDDSVAATSATPTTVAATPAPSSTEAPTTTPAPTTTSTPTSSTTTLSPQIPDELADFEIRSVTVDYEPWLVAIADTPELRPRGLMFVTDLGDLDGMLFVFDEPTAGSFWMKNTLIPLDIAFFRADGTLVAVLEMMPCGDQDPCPTYGPGEDYQYALEAPAGDLVGLDPGTVLGRQWNSGFPQRPRPVTLATLTNPCSR